MDFLDFGTCNELINRQRKGYKA